MISHFTAHTINCVCHSIRSMFSILRMYNFGPCYKNKEMTCKIKPDFRETKHRHFTQFHSPIFTECKICLVYNSNTYKKRRIKGIKHKVRKKPFKTTMKIVNWISSAFMVSFVKWYYSGVWSSVKFKRKWKNTLNVNIYLSRIYWKSFKN